MSTGVCDRSERGNRGSQQHAEHDTSREQQRTISTARERERERERTRERSTSDYVRARGHSAVRRAKARQGAGQPKISAARQDERSIEEQPAISAARQIERARESKRACAREIDRVNNHQSHRTRPEISSVGTAQRTPTVAARQIETATIKRFLEQFD